MGVFGDWATKYWEAGYSPLPITPGSKGPTHLPDWQRFSVRARATEEELAALIFKYTDYGIGLAGGPASGIVFLDIDADSEKFPEYEHIVRGIIPPSPIERVGRKGFAGFYRCFDSELVSRTYQSFFDVIAGGRQLVIPPTIHPETNQPYRWTGQSEDPIHTPLDELPVLTQAMINELWSATTVYGEKKGVFKSGTAKPSIFGDFKSPDGERSPHLSQERMKRLCVAMIMEGKGPTEVIRQLSEHDARYHDKSYFTDARKISDARYDDRYANIVLFYLRIFKSLCDFAQNSPEKHFPPQPAVVAPPTQKLPDIYARNEKNRMVPQFHRFAEYIKEKYHAYSDDDSAKALKYRYNGLFYEELRDGRLYGEMFNCAKELLQPTHVDAFIKTVDVHLQSKGQPMQPNGLINCANGIVNITTKEIRPHTPDIAFHYCLSTAFEPDAYSETFEWFLNDVMEGDTDRVLQLQMFIGQTIMGGAPRDHRALVLYGSGFNGKSTLLTVIRSLLGVHNTTSISMKRLGDRFAPIGLKNKLANIVDETPAREGIDAEVFKTCVAGGMITAEQKNKPAEQFHCHARFIFSCNEFPRFNDATFAMERRLLIIPFNKRITSKRIGLDDQLQKEMPGILNWALEGYRLFVHNGYKIVSSQAERDLMQEYRQESNSIASFFAARIEKTGLDFDCVTATDLYNHYVAYCHASGLHCVNIITFGKRLREEVNNNPKCRATVQQGKTLYRGLKCTGEPRFQM